MNTIAPFPIERPVRLPQLPAAQQWLIEGLWAHQAVGIIGGEPKSYKSFIALSMALAVASGRHCLGRYRVETPGTVLLFAAEDALHIVRSRLEGLCASQKLELAQLDLWIITEPTIHLDQQSDQARLEKTVSSIRPRLLVLDPFVRLHTGDENLSAIVAPLLAFLRELQRKYGVAVALVHHARKGSTAMRAGQALRGSSELHAWGDSNLYVRHHKNRLTLSTEHRAQAAQTAIPLVLETNGSSLLLSVTEHESNSGQTEQRTPSQEAHEKVLQALAGFSAPARTRQLRNTVRIRAQSLSSILKDLVNKGQVIRTDAGWTVAQRQQ